MAYQAHSCQRQSYFLDTCNFSKHPSYRVSCGYRQSINALYIKNISWIWLTFDDGSMYYHHLILTLYEPLLEVKTNQEPSPHQIIADAKKYLQTLVRVYYLRHGFEAMDLFIVIPLILAGSDCIDAINEQTPSPKLETLRSTLILVAKGLFNQRRNHYLAEALFRVIRGRMRHT